MSDPVTKAVEDQPVVAPVESTPAEPTSEINTEEPAAPVGGGSAAASEPAKDAGESDAAAETPKAPVKATTTKKEFTGEGFLGYKAPGGIIKKLAGFQKKWFWFGEEPVDSKNLTSYLRGEKPEFANHNAAWSSHTGRGLLYFSKHTSEKPSPAGIINLAEVSDIVKDGTSEISFHMHAAKHVLQASTPTERDSWFTALEKKSGEAKEMVEGVKKSDAYQEQYSSLSKPAAAAMPVSTALGAATKDGEVKDDKADTKEEKKEDKSRKSRSASRKRNSIFANFSLGSKKEEVAEEKKAESKEHAAAKEVVPVDATTTEQVELSSSAPADGLTTPPAVVEGPVADEAAKMEAPALAPSDSVRPTAANKRNSSIFGSLSSKFGQKKSASERKPSGEVVPEVPTKAAATSEPVSAEAPVIPAPEASEPLPTSVATPTTAPPAEQSNPPAAAEEAKPEMKADSAQKRKSSLPFGLGSPKEKTAEAEGEKPLSPFAKLRQTIKGKSSPKAAEKNPDKADVQAEGKAVEPKTESPATTSEPAATTTDPVISEPIGAVHQPITEVSAAA